MRSISVAVGALFFCSVAPISAEAKTDLLKCEDRCREYNCSGAASLMYCHYVCHKKCRSNELNKASDHSNTL